MEKQLRKLPMIVTRGFTPLPNNEMKIDVGREKSVEAIKLAMEDYDGYIYIVSQKDPLADEPALDGIYDIGAIARIKVSTPIQKGSYRLTFDVQKRGRIENVLEEDPSYIVEVMEQTEYSVDEKAEYALLRSAIDAVESYIKSNGKAVTRLAEELSKGYTASAFSDVIANSLPISIERRQVYLETLEINERLLMVVKDLYAEIEIVQLEEKIERDVRESFDATQREYYLREKLRVIREELGDKNSKDKDAEDLKEQVEKLDAPDVIKEKIREELGRFEMVPTASAESGVIRNYIEWMLAIPWGNLSDDEYTIKTAEKILNEDHFGLEEVKKRILEFLAVKKLTGKTTGAMVCLVGPPGVGKTSLAKSIARSMGREYVKIALGGVRDEAEIRGHRKTYIGAMPGKIIQTLKKAKTMNPVILLDEIDKMASDFRGDPVSALLEVLDPEQNTHFVDHYIEEAVDLSNVLFIMTANYYSGIPEPLMDRMEIIELGSYTEEEKLSIALQYLIPKQFIATGVTPKNLVLEEEALKVIIKKYAREAGVRGLEREIAKICRKVAAKVTEDADLSIRITEKDIETYLGKPKYRYTTIDKENQVGVVSGLAYTSFGGDVLPVEVTLYQGKENLVLTGKLGDVMKESAMIALSYVKSQAATYKIDMADFEKNTIHIHFPEGAVPKDGPSAGVTIATAIISAMTNQPVERTVGMTGEITLRGNVLPIGGLKEKAMAAYRSGLKTIIIPEDNLKDIDEIPKSVKAGLTILPARTLADILPVALSK
ncbi:lon protease [Erysipelotrichaceae bacterium]|nr:lon protease [Erysipelotrichaceae bacterium]